jgi:nicotinamidase-related amidase
MQPSLDPGRTALLLVDLQNDFLHPEGAYGRSGQGASAIAALPARLKPLTEAMRNKGCMVIATQFTLVPGRAGEPIVSPHLLALRPFLAKGDFVPGGWGHATVEELQPVDIVIEKIAYSAFYMTRLEWVLRKCGIAHLVVGGIVSNGGVASTVRDAHVRDIGATVLTDGCAAFTPETHETAMAALGPVARLATIASVMAEIAAA